MYLNMKDKWETIKNHAFQGIEALFPLETNKRILQLVRLDMKDVDISVDAQRNALVTSGNLTVPIYGTFRLIDNKDHRALDEDRVKILDLPVITHRGTFVVQGKDYNVFNQTRLRPGVYTMKSEDSDSVSSRFNLGRGLGFRIILSDDASVFYVTFDSSKAHAGGQKKIPLYSLLIALGARDDDMERLWGKRLFESNKVRANVQEDVRAIHELVVYQGKRTANEISDIRAHFENTLLNEDTTKVTLGRSYEKVTAQTLLDATSRMIKVYKDEDPGDDLDSLLFKEILSAEDHIFLRITKGAKQSGGLMFKIRRKMDMVTKVRDCVPTSFLSKLVETFFTTSDLSSPQTEINPIEILETNHKLTAMGEGGIKSEHGIPMSARNLHPSHFGFVDPVRTTESTRVGVDLRATFRSFVKNRNIYTSFIDNGGKKVNLRPIDLWGKVVGFPGQEGEDNVKAMVQGEMKIVNRKDVDYWMDKPRDMFTYTSNLVPFLHNDQGNRVTMASRMLTQAVPLVNREAPYVQIKGDTHKSIEEELGSEYFSPKAPEDGVVKAVTPKYIQVNDKKIDVYTNFPLNYKTFIHMEPLVKPGDAVKKGQILAESNFTKNGVLSLGTNLRVAYVPYKGWNHEDGIVISDKAAEKLTSQHMYVKELELLGGTVVDKHRFAILFPGKITAPQLAKLDDEGIAKLGAVLERGDYVIAAIGKRELSEADHMMARMHKSLMSDDKDSSVVWDHDRPGTVTDVIRSGSLIKVIFRTEDEARVGDKLTGRHGNKGTITMILPENEMPYNKEGRPVDVLLNPAGVISRVNPGQLYDTMAGKLAEKTGKTYYVENFSPKDSSKKVLKELKDADVIPEEELIDPKTKQNLGKIFVGNQYTLKLHKQTEGNFSARSTASYDANLQPAKGGEEGAKAVGLQDFYAFLGHNARANLHEIASYKSQKNQEFWDNLRMGYPLPPAKEPFVFDKFKALLGGTGINVQKHENAYVISPLHDKEVLRRSSGEIKSGLMLNARLAPEDGGLFDRKTTGGKVGKNWSHIDLAEPIPHPLFEHVIKALTKLDPKEASGKEIHDALASIKFPGRITEIEDSLKTAKGSTRDKLIKEYRYLIALQKMGMKPTDYVLTKFPIMPPVYRPIYPSPNGGAPMVSDINHLYRDLINTNNTLKEMKHFPDEDKQDLKKLLYQAAGAVIGTTEPVNMKSKKQELKGALQVVTGPTAKSSFFQRKLTYRPLDLTGRGTILPDPHLHIDEAKIPQDMAYELFEPFIARNLVKRGYKLVDALHEVEQKSPAAKIALEEEMKTRPIMLNRAPTLHKYNVLAFKPIPTEGKSIFIPPLVIKGFNADFDGDSVSGETWVVVKDDMDNIVMKQIKDVT